MVISLYSDHAYSVQIYNAMFKMTKENVRSFHTLYEHLYDKDRPQERFRKYKTKIIMKQRLHKKKKKKKKKLNNTF